MPTYFHQHQSILTLAALKPGDLRITFHQRTLEGI